MVDLLESARLFEVSSRLQRAALSLDRMTQSMSLQESDRKDMRWAGQFLTEVDWTYTKRGKAGLGTQEEMGQAASTTRPLFYAAVIKLGSESFSKVGIETQADIMEFFSRVYQFLISEGEKASLQSAELALAGRLLKVISRTLLAQLSNNGVTERPTQLTLGAAC